MNALPLLFLLACTAQPPTAPQPAPVPDGPTEADRALVFTARQVAAAEPRYEVDASAEQWSVTREPTGRVEVVYTYKRRNGGLSLVVTSLAAHHSNAAAAEQHYTALSEAMSTEVPGSTTRTVDDLLTWGDEASCTLLSIEGVSGGNVCVFRKGATVGRVQLAGPAWTEPGEASAALAGVLTALETWTPETL